MKRPHLLVVEGGGDAYAAVLSAAAALGLRVGWLDLSAVVEPAATADGLLAAGAHRVVEVGRASTRSFKARRGPAVLDDLLREHFLGCALVLVEEPADDRVAMAHRELPRLAAVGDGWVVTVGPRRFELSAEELAKRLRRPRPWGPSDGPRRLPSR